MFVSSYSTYIQTNSSNKTAKNVEKEGVSDSKFSSKLLKSSSVKLENLSDIHTNYISTNQILKNRQKLNFKQNPLNFDNKEMNKTVEISQKFIEFKTLNNAKTAYDDNSKMFSLRRKPIAILDQTPKIDANLPEDIKSLKEKNLRQTMVNTYLSNDLYYKITA